MTWAKGSPPIGAGDSIRACRWTPFWVAIRSVMRTRCTGRDSQRALVIPVGPQGSPPERETKPGEHTRSPRDVDHRRRHRGDSGEVDQDVAVVSVSRVDDLVHL